MRWSTPVLAGTAMALVVGLGSYMFANPPALNSYWEDVDILGSAQGTVTRDNPLEASAWIPNGSGMFVVEILDTVEDVRLSALVTSPAQTYVASASIDRPIYTGVFRIQDVYWFDCGNMVCPGGIGGDLKKFTLTIESNSADPVNVVAMLGKVGASAKGAHP